MNNDIFFLDDIENQLFNNIKKNQEILHEPFIFHAYNYEIYEKGKLLKSEKCNITINAFTSDYEISFFIQHNNEIIINNKFSIEFRSDDLLIDRIQYGRLPQNMNIGSNTLPIVCEIFPQKNILRFAVLLPLRLIEFTGHLQKLNLDKNNIL